MFVTVPVEIEVTFIAQNLKLLLVKTEATRDFTQTWDTQKKQIHKATHLIKQIKGKYEEVFTDILNAMEPSIEHIDLYHATCLHKNPTEDPIGARYMAKEGGHLAHLKAIYYLSMDGKNDEE